jgi:hypothetical protein
MKFLWTYCLRSNLVQFLFIIAVEFQFYRTVNVVCPTVNTCHLHSTSYKPYWHVNCIGAPILLGRCPLSLLEGECMLRTYLVCREKREREREISKLHRGEAHSILTTAILLPQRPSCYGGKIVSFHMFTESYARRLASDHCATGIHRPKSAFRPIAPFAVDTSQTHLQEL